MIRTRAGLLVLGVVCSCAAIACALTTSLDGLTGGATPDAAILSDADLDTPADSPPHAPDGDAFDGASTSDACPPQMVLARTFCIDAVEVTRAAYMAYVAAGAPPAGIAACAWKTSYLPPSDWPPTTNLQRPVGYVDWCDAYAYCKWANKRLCGRIGGGSLAAGDRKDPSKDQWYAACSQGGARVYPYGNVYVATACNGADRDAGGTVDVGSLAACEGGHAGLFDMSGNAAEIVDACQDAGGDAAADTCFACGGHTDGTATYLTCPTCYAATRSGFRYSNTGFRCCGP
jgi:formylglycine-generating enzyme required for sulfatase activity